MRAILLVSAFGGLFFAAVAMAQPPAAPDLQVGSRAPEFSLPGSDGKTHRLAELTGKRAVVLAWFPKAFTGG